MPPERLLENKAARACRHCRLHKRRCDKKLPRCSTCSSKWTRCEYDDDTPTETVDPDTELEWSEPLAIRRFLCGLELTPAGEKQLLWTVCHGKGPYEAESDSISVMSLVKDIFSYGGTTVEEVTGDYFAKVHEWLPIVYKPTVISELERISLKGFTGPRDNPMALLLLCMDMINHHCRHPHHGPNTLLYRTTRRLFSLVEASGHPKQLAKLQAGLLLTAYECGHGMAVEASLTLATCVGLVRQLDMSASRNPYTGEAPYDTMRNLCWAAIIFLDRAITFSCSDGTATLLIPTRGSLPQDLIPFVTQVEFAEVDTETKFQARVYAALCIGEAIAAVPGLPNASDCAAVEALFHDLVRQHAETSDDKDIYPVCEGMAMALSAVASLYKRRAQNPGSAADAKLSLDIKFAYNIAFEMCRVEGALIKTRKGSHAHRLCFSGLSCLYRAAVDLDEISPNGSTPEDFKQLRENLKWFLRHWSVADRLIGRTIHNSRSRIYPRPL
ncbi:hypothetical protein V8C44DRAFT_370519 [Trichoderma aethiopicum]